MSDLNEWDRQCVDGAVEQIRFAKQRIATFDRIDGKDSRLVSLQEQLGDVSAALVAGLADKRWDSIADALVMLSQCADPMKVQGAVRFNTFVG